MKYLRWSGIACISIIGLIALLVAFVLSPWGTQFGIAVANNTLNELSVDYKKGGLASEIVLNRLQWQQHNADVSIENIALKLDLSCLWSLSLCVENIASGKVIISVSSSETETATAEKSAPLTLPLKVVLRQANIGELALNINQQMQLSWQSLSTSLQFYEQLDIAYLNISSFVFNQLTPTNTTSATTASQDWKNWQYQPLTKLDFSLPLSFSLKDMQVKPLTLQADGRSTFSLNSVKLVARGKPEELTVSKLTLEHEQGELLAQAHVMFDGILSHKLEINAKVKEPSLGDLALNVTSKGDLNSLFVDVKSQGASNIEAKIAAQLSAPALPLDITLDWTNLQWPIVTTEQQELIAQSPAGHFSIKGDLFALNITGQSSVVGPNVPSSTINIAALANKNRLKINTLELQTLAGKINAQASVSYEQFLTASANVDLQHINPGLLNADYQGDLNGQLTVDVSNQNEQWLANVEQLSLAGQFRGFPLTLSGKASLDKNATLKLNQLHLTNGANSLQVDGTLLQDKTLDLQLQLNANNIEQTIANVSGRLTAELNLSGNLAQPALTYTLAGNQISFADIMLASVTGQGDLVWNDEKPVNIGLELKQIQGINNQVDEAIVSLKGNALSHELLIDTTSNKTNLRAKIQGALSDISWQGQWLEGQVESAYASLSLVEPFDIKADWGAQNYAIGAHCWQQDKSDLCINKASFKDQQAQWDIALHELNLFPLIHRILPQFPAVTSASQLSMTLQGHWDIDQLPEAKLHASLSPAAWSFKDKKELVLDLKTFDVDAQISAKNVSIVSVLSGPQIGSMSLHLQGEAGEFSEQLNRPIAGEFNLRDFNLAPFKILLPNLDKFEGVLVGNSAISGTLDKPLLNGVINLENGAVQGEGIPLIISGVQQKVELIDDKALINGSYQLGKGKGSIEGQVNWRPDLSGQVLIKGDALEFDYQSMLRAQVTPNINIQFSPELVNISGDVKVPYARFKLRELPKGSISPSKDVVLVEQQGKEENAEQFLKLNLTVLVDPQRTNQVKLDAFGLTSDLKGSLRLENGKQGMLANGDMQLVNGRYKAYGQNLIIREGDITFNGAIDRPFLSIEAIRDPDLTQNSVVAGIRVTGASDSPKVEVFSEPEMEQQQSLSYVLTGHGIGESSGDSQDVMLRNMLLSIGLGQSENMVSNIGQKLGFKDVSLDTSGQGQGTQLAVSGYIAPGVQLRYGVGVFETVTEVAIRYELLPQLYVEAVSGLSNAIDIYYSFSLDNKRDKNDKDKE